MNDSGFSKKKILLITPHLTFGGAERVFHDHAEAFAHLGHEVTECLFDLAIIAFPTRNKLVSLNVSARRNIIGKIVTFIQRVRRVSEIKKETKIDICISHLEGADYLNLLSNGASKVILCVHNSKRHDPNIKGALGWLRRNIFMPWLYQRADKIVAVSRDLRQELIDTFNLPPDKVTTINNFFAIEDIRRKSQEDVSILEAALFSNQPVLLSSGRLGPEKNQVALLFVLAELHKRGRQNTKLVLLGDGPMREDIVAKCEEIGLRSWQADTNVILDNNYDVYFFGFQANPFRYIARATLALLPSLTEGFPMALCEAMACHIPVLSADCPTGPREILAPKTPANQYAFTPEWSDFGVLLPLLTSGHELPIAVGHWVTALDQLLTNDELRDQYKIRARKRVEDFSPDKIMKQWEKLL